MKKLTKKSSPLWAIQSFTGAGSQEKNVDQRLTEPVTREPRRRPA